MSATSRGGGVSVRCSHRTTLSSVICALVVALLIPASALADRTYYNHADSFDHSYHEVLQGTVTADGCSWHVPMLDSSNVHARQVWTDGSTCTSDIEYGLASATEGDDDPSDGTSANVTAQTSDEAEDPTPPPNCMPLPYPPYLACRSEEAPAALDSQAERGAQAAAFTRRGRFVVWWEDFIHIDVTKARAHLSFEWDGSCVRSRSGHGSTWWRSGTGWSRVSASAGISRLSTLCSTAQRVWTDAFYENTVFCNNDVYNQYDNVTVRGDKDGHLRGWVKATTATHCAGRPDLHWHARLFRE